MSSLLLKFACTHAHRFSSSFVADISSPHATGPALNPRRMPFFCFIGETLGIFSQGAVPSPSLFSKFEHPHKRSKWSGSPSPGLFVPTSFLSSPDSVAGPAK